MRVRAHSRWGIAVALGALVLVTVPQSASAAPRSVPNASTDVASAPAASTSLSATTAPKSAPGQVDPTQKKPGVDADPPRAGIAGDLDNDKGTPGVHLPASGGGSRTSLPIVAKNAAGQLAAGPTLAAAKASAATTAATPAAAAATDPCTGTTISAIACENSKPGTPDTTWDVVGAGDDGLAGFATDISVNVGQTVHLKVKSTGAYRVDIYRVGYYGGAGARLMTSFTPQVPYPQVQPTCQKFADTGLMDCGNWAESASWAIPATAVSGLYFARLTRLSNGAGSHIPFVVRNDASHSQVLFQTSDPTWEAYNTWGDQSTAAKPNNWGPGLGNSLYVCNDACPPGSPKLYKGAYAVSYNRPFDTRTTPDGQDWMFAAEYPMIRFLERNGYDVSYTSGVDTDRRGALVKNHSMFMSNGHDEYWSAGQRANVEAARDAGVNLAFFSGNEVFWKTRYEDSKAGPVSSYRTLITYKDTHFDAQTDPTGIWTGTWRDPRFSPPGDGGRPENGLTGVAYMVDPPTDFAMKVSAAFGKLRFWRNTPLATMTTGTLTLANATLGYEFDADLDNGSRPNGLFHLTEQTEAVQSKLQDYGNTVGPGTVTHSMTEYRAPSGALVFGSGTVQWSFGLDGDHDGPASTANTTQQQATVNLLADMGAQPATLATGLVAATKSTDTVKPTSTISSSAHAVVAAAYSITGTAADTGGRVGGIEVSTDGGSTWHPATGTTSWTYRFTATSPGTVTVLARATDDSGNIQATPTSKTLTVDPRTCPCSIFGSVTPDTPQVADATAYELGVRFRATVPGTISGVRFYKGANNTGSHTGTLWSNTGQQLATGTFSAETATGWQTLTFSSPVTVAANTTYLASYHTDTGFYANDPTGFTDKAAYSAPLFALPDGLDGPNGVFHTGAGAFPASSVGGNNYFVDVVFNGDPSADTAPPAVASSTPQNTATSVPSNTTVTVDFNKPVNPSSLSFQLLNGTTVVASSVKTGAGGLAATLTPAAALAAGVTYTVRVSAADLAGHAMTTPYTGTFRTGAAQPPPGTCPCSLWSDQQQPQVPSAADPNPVELGVKVVPSGDGWITGVRFFKGPQNTGAHTGTLWSAAGVALATATFSTESATGWQQVSFDPAVQVTAGTTYVASYHSNGDYSYTANYFATAGTSYGPLSSPKNATATAPNGVFAYGPAGTFPRFGTDSANNYWVDVTYQTTAPPPQPPAVSGTTPAAGETGSALSSPVTVTFNKSVQPSTLGFTLTSNGTAVPGTTTYDDASRTATFTPSASLVAARTYSAAVTATSTLGMTMPAPYTWSFSTGTPATCPCTLYGTATPTNTTTDDAGDYELGVRFRSDQDGFVNGVRFYKGAGNTGVHTGSLWSTDGQELATATFGGESASGWQSVTFDTSVPVRAGVDYIASYHTATGHYAFDGSFFDHHNANAAPLHALASTGAAPNGVYNAGGHALPQRSFGETNYWVDVTFSTTRIDTVPPRVSSVLPVDGDTFQPATVTPMATFSEPVTAGTIAMTLSSAAGPVTGTVGYDSASQTATFTPSAALAGNTTYTATASATDTAGNAMTTPFSWTFTTTPAAGCPCSLFGAAPPTGAATDDASDVELGVQFTSDTGGQVRGVRFYKATGNSGTHTGTLWSSAGAVLATGTFAGESATGWQTLTFATPVPITAGTQYVVSYHAPSGHYAGTPHYYDAGYDKAPLHVPASGGVYHLGAGFPQSTFGAANYWVDLVFG